MALTVKFAVYGAQRSSDERRARDVRQALQNRLDESGNNVITINNETMGGDPAPGQGKHFGAIVDVNGAVRAFACAEGQNVDFD